MSKKKKIITDAPLTRVLQTACHRRILAQISTPTHRFTGRFLTVEHGQVFLENNLSHLDDVRQLRNQAVQIYFPFRNTLLRGDLQLSGLTTYQNRRALSFKIPKQLTVDEKRAGKRFEELPKEAFLTFSDLNLRLFQAKIVDLSMRGIGFVMHERAEPGPGDLQITQRIQADAMLDATFKLSFEAEIRHISEVNAGASLKMIKIGAKMLNLEHEATISLHQWLFQMDAAQNVQTPSQTGGDSLLIMPREKTPNTILVVSDSSDHLDFWSQCLGRKFEIITTDLNIANIRMALSAGPMLALVHLDPGNPARASFTRKLCASFMDRQPLVLFGEEPDERKRQTLTGSLKYLDFIDTSERKILDKFRKVDDLMKDL